MFNFLSVFDLFRYVLGLLSADFILCINDHKRRNHFTIRIIVITLIILALSFLRFLILLLGYSFVFLDAIFWVLLSLTGVLFVYFSFRVSKTVALYKNILGSILQQIPTIIIRYLIDSALLIDFSKEHTVAYVFITIGVYALFYILIYFLLIRRLFIASNEAIKDNPRSFIIQIVITLLFSSFSSLIAGIFDDLLLSLQIEDAQVNQLRFFLIAMELAFCVVAFVLEWSIYDVGSKRRESKVMQELVKERERQYLQSQLAISMIKKQSHDLKHAIKAIQLFSSNERKDEYITQVLTNLAKFDAFIKTSSPALSTLLTDKSLQCNNANIRFSTSISDIDLSFIDTIDLYTCLSNALENSIESTKKIADEEKRVISFKMEKKKNLVIFNIQNYFEGQIKYNKGQIKTSKKDESNHGIGLKSIRSIAEKYKGNMSIKVSDDIFSLTIIFPEN